MNTFRPAAISLSLILIFATVSCSAFQSGLSDTETIDHFNQIKMDLAGAVRESKALAKEAVAAKDAVLIAKNELASGRIPLAEFQKLAAASVEASAHAVNAARRAESVYGEFKETGEDLKRNQKENGWKWWELALSVAASVFASYTGMGAFKAVRASAPGRFFGSG